MGASESRKARKAAEAEAARNRQAIEAQTAEAKRQADLAAQKQAEIERKQGMADQVAAQASRRRRQSTAANQGRQSTILTGPMGLGTDVSRPASTILGG